METEKLITEKDYEKLDDMITYLATIKLDYSMYLEELKKKIKNVLREV